MLPFVYALTINTATGLGGKKTNVCASYCHVHIKATYSKLCCDVSNVLFVFWDRLYVFTYLCDAFLVAARISSSPANGDARHTNRKANSQDARA